MTVENLCPIATALAVERITAPRLDKLRATIKMRLDAAMFLQRYGARIHPGGLPVANVAARWRKACRVLDEGAGREHAALMNSFAHYVTTCARALSRRGRRVLPFKMNLTTLGAIRALCALAATEATP